MKKSLQSLLQKLSLLFLAVFLGGCQVDPYPKEYLRYILGSGTGVKTTYTTTPTMYFKIDSEATSLVLYTTTSTNTLVYTSGDYKWGSYEGANLKLQLFDIHSKGGTFKFWENGVFIDEDDFFWFLGAIDLRAFIDYFENGETYDGYTYSDRVLTIDGVDYTYNGDCTADGDMLVGTFTVEGTVRTLTGTVDTVTGDITITAKSVLDYLAEADTSKVYKLDYDTTPEFIDYVVDDTFTDGYTYKDKILHINGTNYTYVEVDPVVVEKGKQLNNEESDADYLVANFNAPEEYISRLGKDGVASRVQVMVDLADGTVMVIKPRKYIEYFISGKTYGDNGEYLFLDSDNNFGMNSIWRSLVEFVDSERGDFTEGKNTFYKLINERLEATIDYLGNIKLEPYVE